MDAYTITMRSLSVIGFLTLILSVYIFKTVPAQLSALFRFSIISTSVCYCCAQILLTLGVTPTIFLPCFAVYPNGILQYFGMSSYYQLLCTIFLFGTGGYLNVLICVLRALAISLYLSERRKKFLISAYCVCSLSNYFIGIPISLFIQISEENRRICMEKFDEYPPPTFFLKETIVLNLETDKAFSILIYLGLLSICFVSTIGVICTSYLVWSLRRQKRNYTTSNKLLDNHRKLTIAVLKINFSQLVGIGLPPGVILLSALLNVNSEIIPVVTILVMSVTPILACIWMLRLIPAYKKRMNEICFFVFPYIFTEQNDCANSTKTCHKTGVVQVSMDK